jgi:hypothetical protein
MPAIQAAQEYVLSDYDVNNCKDSEGLITRDSVEQWLCTHSGDFQKLDDFSASIELDGQTIDIPWNNEEAEFAFGDCMYPCED